MPFTVLLSLGTLGYYFFFDHSWIDAFYMTVITVTTVGFGEQVALSDAGKLFTTFLILSSVLSYAYLIQMLSNALSLNFFSKMMRINKNLSKIAGFEQHTIICGYGRNGEEALNRLVDHGKTCVVVDVNEEVLEHKLKENASVAFVVGDATDDEVLKDAGIEKAKDLVVCFPSDADNLYTILSAKQLNPGLRIVSRATCSSAHRKMLTAGASHVILPERLGGNHMALLLAKPDLVEFVDKISVASDGSPNLQEIEASRFPKKFLNQPIKDLDLRKKTGCNIIGFVTDDGRYIVNPSSKIPLTHQSNLIVLGTPDQVARIEEVYKDQGAI